MVREGVGEHANFAALRICVFAFLLIEISSRKAVPEVTSTFPGPLHEIYAYRCAIAEMCALLPFLNLCWLACLNAQAKKV